MHPDFTDFISDEDEKRILKAIARAENNTSGEIRVHLHRNGKGDVFKNAVKTFEKLGMTRTALRNGVLIYIDVDKRQFAVIGDQGIHAKVDKEFWKRITDVLHRDFSQNKFTDGIVAAVLEIGKQLKRHFPYRKDDINELPDEISYQ